MTMKGLIEKTVHELQVYIKEEQFKKLIKTHISFCGLPLKHPNDPGKIILIIDPLGNCPYYYEFKSKDIFFGEKLPCIVNMRGQTTNMSRIWVKKKSIGVRCTPFFVENGHMAFSS